MTGTAPHRTRRTASAAGAARWRAIWRVDLRSALLGGLAVLLVLVVFGAVLVQLVGDVSNEVRVEGVTFAENWIAFLVIIALATTGDAARGRRETLLGGWTRRQQGAVLAVQTAVLAAIGMLGYLACALAVPAVNAWLAEMAGPSSEMSFHEPRVATAAIATVGLALVAAAHAPRMLLLLNDLHWSAVVGGAAGLLLLQSALVHSYLQAAYPNPDLIEWRYWWGLPSEPTTLIAAILLTTAIVVGTHLAWRRAPIRRYGA